MGANVLGTADQTALITTSIRRKFIPILRNKLRFDQFAEPGTLLVNGGAKTLRWNLASDIGTYTTALTEDTTTAENKVTTITITGLLMTVSDYGAWAPISDLADSVWTAETRAQYADIMAYSGAKTRDVLLRNAAQTTTNYVVSNQTAANTGSLFTTSTAIAQDLNVIRGFFDQNDCDGFENIGGNYALMIHGKVEQDMVGDVTTGRLSWSPLIWYTETGVQRIINYRGPGALLGCAVMRTNVIGKTFLTVSTTPSSNSGTVTSYQCVALADHGLGKTTLDQSEPRIIMKRPGPSTVSVPLDEYGTIGWKMRMAQANLHATRALSYYAAAGVGS